MKNKQLIILGLIVALVIFVIILPSSSSAENKPPSTGPVRIEGKQLLVDFDGDGAYEPFIIKGLGYSPYPIGRYPFDWGQNIFDNERVLRRDLQVLQEMHANTMRIWKANPDFYNSPEDKIELTKKTFVLADEYGLKIIPGFWVRYDLDLRNKDTRAKLCNQFKDLVLKFKDCPALLFWAIGNEQNYHNGNNSNWYSLVNEMAEIAYKTEGDTYHPVAVVNGEIANINNPGLGTTDLQLPYLDIWGINAYRGYSFGNLFRDFANKSAKPIWISEFGIDAWDNELGREDESTQAEWDVNLFQEAFNADVCIGATLMSYCDEWWKPQGWKNPSTHDASDGFRLAGATPDNFLNEEYWGVVALKQNGGIIDEVNPREVYSVLKDKFAQIDEKTFILGGLK